MKSTILSPAWWFSEIVAVLISMAFIVLIKRFTQKVNIPIVSDMAQEV